MVPKLKPDGKGGYVSFRAVLFRMVPKHTVIVVRRIRGFRAVLFRMVPKLAIV